MADEVADDDREAPRAVGRRRFVFWSIAAGLASLSGGATSLLARNADAKGAAKKAAPQPATPAPAMAPPAEISDEARALHGVLIARYGKDLDAARSKGLLESVENTVQSGKALRAKKLFNGQEPATVFVATVPGPRAKTEGGR
jgi:hypothetical protein